MLDFRSDTSLNASNNLRWFTRPDKRNPNCFQQCGFVQKPRDTHRHNWYIWSGWVRACCIAADFTRLLTSCHVYIRAALEAKFNVAILAGSGSFTLVNT